MINDPPKAERVYVTVQRPNIDPKQLQDELQRVLDEVGERIRKLENLVKAQKDLQYVTLRALVDHGVTDLELTCEVLTDLAETANPESYERAMLLDMARQMHAPHKARKPRPFHKLLPDRQ